MKYIGLLLHLYQPPTQDINIVEKIDRECYLPLSALLRNENIPVSINLCFSLTEHLEKLKSGTISNLLSADAVEFTTSGAYHPIFPLIPEIEVARQIEINNYGNRKFLGDRYSPEGVFPPEMAITPDVCRLLNSNGYKWTIADDLPWTASGRSAPLGYVIECEGIVVLLRSNFWSNRISFHMSSGVEIARELFTGFSEWSRSTDRLKDEEENSYIIIAMDGETFGHHVKGAIESFLRPFLHEIQKTKDAELLTLGDIVKIFPARKSVIPSGTWSTSLEDIAAGIVFPLWDHPDNFDHKALREVRDIVLSWARKCHGERVALLADKMLYSCPFWWAASGRKNPLQVRRGALLVMETALAALEETGNRAMADSVMSALCKVPVLTGESR